MTGLALVLVLTAAPAELEVGQPWSVVGARTLKPGSNAVIGELGFPAISVGYLRGVRSGFELGARVGFAWSVEGLPVLAAGSRAQALVRLRFVDQARISLGVTVEPGFGAYDGGLQGSRLLVLLPVGLRLGIAASSALQLGVMIDVPLWLELGSFGGVNVPILTGVGAEYFVTSQLALIAKVRVGPTLRSSRPTEVAFDATLGVGYQF